MMPFLATYHGERVIVLAFVYSVGDIPEAVIVRSGGGLDSVRVNVLVADLPAMDWPEASAGILDGPEYRT